MLIHLSRSRSVLHIIPSLQPSASSVVLRHPFSTLIASLVKNLHDHRFGTTCGSHPHLIFALPSILRPHLLPHSSRSHPQSICIGLVLIYPSLLMAHKGRSSRLCATNDSSLQTTPRSAMGRRTLSAHLDPPLGEINASRGRASFCRSPAVRQASVSSWTGCFRIGDTASQWRRGEGGGAYGGVNDYGAASDSHDCWDDFEVHSCTPHLHSPRPPRPRRPPPTLVFSFGHLPHTHGPNKAKTKAHDRGTQTRKC
jgi:hypothetical protein